MTFEIEDISLQKEEEFEFKPELFAKKQRIKIEKIDGRLKPNSAKQFAQQNGITRFVGKDCLHGHGGERYTKGGRCVKCTLIANGSKIARGRSQINIEAAQKAAIAGKSTYIPQFPCNRGHLLRFITTNNCVECSNESAVRNKISQKHNRIRREYGLTKEQHEALYEKQNKRCKICSKQIDDMFKMHIDHCHSTLKVRGLLCNKCNQGLGLFNEDLDLFEKAVNYLKENAT
jgi:hypothetical protein